jgi:hypothetical protein
MPQITLDHQDLAQKPIQSYGGLQRALQWLGFSASSSSGSTVYGGKVTSAGAASTPFPSGWSVSTPGTGRYVITHNLNTTDYAVSVTNVGFFSNVGAITSIGSNSFEVIWYENTVGATWPAANTAFEFILVAQN